MKRFLLFIVLILFTKSPCVLNAQSSENLKSDEIEKKLERAKEKFQTGDEEESLKLYLEILDSEAENYDALWNSSLIYARKGFRMESESDQEEYFNKALEKAQKAKEYHDDKGRSYYAYAVAKGRMTDLMGNRDRIRAAHEIKENISKAAELEPDYAPIWHLYGVWHSDVANVSRGERIAARVISGGVPDASNEKAEEYLKKAIEMDSGSILFKMDLTRHYIEIGEDEKAKTLLEEILEMEPVTKDDPGKLEEAEKLLSEL
jgi:FimV-like protein